MEVSKSVATFHKLFIDGGLQTMSLKSVATFDRQLIDEVRRLQTVSSKVCYCFLTNN